MKKTNRSYTKEFKQQAVMKKIIIAVFVLTLGAITGSGLEPI